MGLKRGFGYRFYIVCIVSVPIWCCFASISYAQDASATLNTTGSSLTTQSSTQEKEKMEAKKSGPNNAKARKTNQSLAQGLSVAEAAILSQTPWGFSLSTSAGRGIDEYADTWSSSTALDMSYSLNKSSAIGLSVGYDTILISYDGDLFNNKANDPRQYGLSDVELSYSLPNVWSDKYNRLVVNTALSLPASTTSQRAGMVADLSIGTALRYRPFSRLIITPQVGIYARSYRYETADARGFLPNSPYGASYGLAASFIFLPWLTSSAAYSQVQRFDYYEDWRTIQSASVQVSAAVADTMTAFAGYRWRDRTISNDSLFDDDKSLIFTGVSYAF